ncbi:Laminin-like protein epi-1 [Gossypium arboreum]|uniref:Laminin-like protein epi-1 n=1 Tax=Gossypium arboreum TaxID=29729 RepID=A0A0B0NYY3_GOSAR|nr:Laminin-like protein epi-1 [Gossypium arboreum]
MTSKAGEIMEKLKEKKVEYEAIASTDSSVNLENIDNRIITEVLGPERLRDQIAQMQASTVEQIAEVQRKYEELQEQLRAEAAEREAAAAAREAAAAAREAEAAAMAVEQSRKYDELQLELQQMMQMFQQSQKPPS